MALNTLHNLNLTASIVHYGLAIGFGLYFNYLNDLYATQPVRGINTTVRDHKLELQYTNNTFSSNWISKNNTTIDIKVVQNLLVSFFLITGSFHLFYYLNGEEDGLYTRVVKAKNNYFRWIEYSITSTMMVYIIAFTAGLKDTNSYILLFATNVSMIATGQMVEEAVRDGKNWQLPMMVGFLLLCFEFYVIARDFWNRLEQVDSFIKRFPQAPDGIPGWVNAMIIVLFLLFSSFGFISLWGAYNNEQYESIEKLYLIFSLGAKATLGFFLAYGTGIRQSVSNRPLPTPISS